MPKRTMFDLRMTKLAIWSGIALVVAMLIAQGFLMHFIPAPSPSLTPEELAQKFIDRQGPIRVGCVIQVIFWTFWATFAMGINMLIRKMEGSWPILTYAAVGITAPAYVFFVIIPWTWAVIAFRAETLDPSVIQIMNDWVWFDFEFTWFPFSLFMVIIAIAILRDHNVPTLYPRWVAYLNLWTAVLLAPASLVIFFKDGLFAYNGFGAFWIPAFAFFGWIAVMATLTLQAISRMMARETSSEDPEDTPLEDTVEKPRAMVSAGSK